MSVVNCSSGQSLVEILIAIGLTGILLPALLTGLVSSREGKAQEGQRLQATALVRESEEAIRSVREKGWTNISTNGTYYPEISGDSWALTSCGGSCPTVNGYTRQIVIADTQRDSNGQIVESGGTVDNSTKKVETTVSWSTPSASSLQTISYFQRYLGNAAFTHTTQADFNGGSNNNTVVTNGGPSPSGAVELTQSGGGTFDWGNKFRATAVTSIGNMTSQNHKTSLRFTAQESKTVNAIRVYLQAENGVSPQYRYGIQTNNPTGNVPSGTWVGNFGLRTATAPGWQPAITLGSPATLTAGTIYHLVVEPTGSPGWPTTSANIGLRRSTPLNNLYPKTNASDPNANTFYKTLAGSWPAAQGFQPIYELDFSDATYEGNPYSETPTQTSIFGSNWYGEKFTVTGSDKIANSVSFCVIKVGTPANNLTVEIRNAANTTIYTGTLLTVAGAPTSYTCPTSWQTHTFTPSPITLTGGVTYRIFLRTSGGTSSNSYRLYRLNAPTTGTNYHSITYDGTNSVYTNATSPGSSWTDSSQYDITFFFTVQGTSTYSANGTFESHSAGSFDAGAPAAFNNITWTANVPVNTTLQLQAAVSASPGGPWDYFGSDGSSGSYFPSSGSIPLNRINGRYLRYKATFTSNGSATPTLNDVSINYSP